MLFGILITTIVFANCLRTVDDEIKVPPNFNQRTEVSYGETTELIKLEQVFQQKAIQLYNGPIKVSVNSCYSPPVSPDIYRRKLFRDCCMVG